MRHWTWWLASAARYSGLDCPRPKPAATCQRCMQQLLTHQNLQRPLGEGEGTVAYPPASNVWMLSGIYQAALCCGLFMSLRMSSLLNLHGSAVAI